MEARCDTSQNDSSLTYMMYKNVRAHAAAT